MSVAKDKQTGKWYYHVRIYDENGNLVKHSKKRGFDTKKAALEAERKILTVVEENAFHDIKFHQVAHHYLELYQARNKARSYYDIRRLIERHILPTFGDKFISGIKPKNILDWQLSLRKMAYSVKYMQVIHTTLSSIFNHAVKYFELSKNPCTVVGNFTSKEKKEMLFWTIDEFHLFLESIDNLKDYAIFYTLFWTGVRKGELLGLQWKDIDFSRRMIRITKAVNRFGTGGHWELTTPKTLGSIRDILVINTLSDILQDLYEQSKAIIGFNDDYFVFGSDKPLSFTGLDRIYKGYITASSVKRIRIHDFRHSYATALIELGVDIMLLAKMLGHSSREQVFSTYGHLYPNKQHEVIAKIENCVQTVSTPKLSIKKAHGCGLSESMVPKVGLEPTRFPVRF